MDLFFHPWCGSVEAVVAAGSYHLVLPPARSNLAVEVSLQHGDPHSSPALLFVALNAKHRFASPHCTLPVTPPRTNLLLFRRPGEFSRCIAPHSVQWRGFPKWPRLALPIGDCGCMVCSPRSAPHCFDGRTHAGGWQSSKVFAVTYPFLTADL